MGAQLGLGAFELLTQREIRAEEVNAAQGEAGRWRVGRAGREGPGERTPEGGGVGRGSGGGQAPVRAETSWLCAWETWADEMGLGLGRLSEERCGAGGWSA